MIEVKFGEISEVGKAGKKLTDMIGDLVRPLARAIDGFGPNYLSPDEFYKNLGLSEQGLLIPFSNHLRKCLYRDLQKGNAPDIMIGVRKTPEDFKIYMLNGNDTPSKNPNFAQRLKYRVREFLVGKPTSLPQWWTQMTSQFYGSYSSEYVDPADTHSDRPALIGDINQGAVIVNSKLYSQRKFIEECNNQPGSFTIL